MNPLNDSFQNGITLRCRRDFADIQEFKILEGKLKPFVDPMIFDGDELKTCLFEAVGTFGSEAKPDKIRAFKSGFKKRINSCIEIAGTMYHYGYLVEKNLQKAEKYHTIAALNGSVFSMTSLGLICGEFIEPETYDPERSIYWHKKAIEFDDTTAMYNLAFLYNTNPDFQIETIDDFGYFAAAAERQHPYDMFVMGKILLGYKIYALDMPIQVETYPHLFDRVVTNPEQAFKYFCAAADAGYGDAMFYRALCHRAGVGTLDDHQLGQHWWKKASSNGCSAAFTLDYSCSASDPIGY